MAGRCRDRRFDWPTLIANKDREIARLEAAYTATLRKGRRHHRQDPRSHCRRPHRAIGDRRARARSLYPDRDRRHAELRRSNSRHRTCDILERGVPFAAFAAACGGPGRRLYRARIRRHFCRSRLARDVVIYRGENILRGFDDEVRAPCPHATWRSAVSRSSPGARLRRSKKPATRFSVQFSNGNQQTSRLHDVRHRPDAERRQTGAAGSGRRDRQEWRHRRRRIFPHQRCQHLCHRRRDQPHQPHASRDPRGGRVCRNGVRRQADGGRSHQRADSGVLGSRSRSGRPDRSGGARAAASGPMCTAPCSSH